MRNMLPLPRTDAVFDTSVWINLLATERVQAILDLVGMSVHLPSQVLRELRRHPITGRPFDPQKHPVPAFRSVKLARLRGNEADLFIELVAAPQGGGLGDGEAAAISVAVHRNAVLAIDERKARRLLAQRFPEVRLLRSSELLQPNRLAEGLGREIATECFEKALQYGRMHID